MGKIYRTITCFQCFPPDMGDKPCPFHQRTSRSRQEALTAWKRLAFAMPQVLVLRPWKDTIGGPFWDQVGHLTHASKFAFDPSLEM